MKGKLMKIIKDHDIGAFLFITFGVGWIFYISAAFFISGNPERESWLIFFQTPGAASSLLAALAVRYARGGKAEIKRGWDQYRLWKQPVWLYVVAAALLPLLAFAAALFAGEVGEGLQEVWQTVGIFTVVLLPVILIAQLFSSPLLEEYGWRGFLQQRLQARISALSSSLIVGFLWGLHHVPVVLAFGGSPVETVFGAVAPSILAAWILNSGKGSMLLVMLLHASLNVSILMIAPQGYIFHILTALAAVTIIIVLGYKNLSKEKASAI